jgi:biotin carboxylase
MTKADLLVVGAGFGQVPAIKTAKAMGLKVLAVDRDLGAPGMEIADFQAVIDVVDLHQIVRVAREFEIRGAITLQSDLPVPAVGAVNDALGLTGVTSFVAGVTSNKIAMRRRLAAAGVPQPSFRIARSVGEAHRACSELGFPCIIKAPDSSGSRGVAKVNNSSHVPLAFSEAIVVSRVKAVLVEEFISGTEFGAQTFSLRGQCVEIHVHDDKLSEPPYFVPIFHSYPASLPSDVVDRGHRVIARAVEALGISDGPANVDAILDEQGIVQIIEVGARVGATCLPELTTAYTGIDWVQVTIESALGAQVSLASCLGRPVAAYILEAGADGILVDWSVNHEVLNDPRVLEWEVTALRNSAVSKLRKGTDRIGKVIVSGNTRESTVWFASIARESVEFHVR